ncbi:MAG TPA: hypothetical protein VGA99_06935 [bacterium]
MGSLASKVRDFEVAEQNKKYIEAISKFNRLTQSGKIKWERRHPPEHLTKGSDYTMVDFYGTNYQGQNLGLYLYKVRAIDPQTGQLYGAEKIKLALFDKIWNESWLFPDVSGIDDLYHSVKYQVADVDGFIDSVLSVND